LTKGEKEIQLHLAFEARRDLPYLIIHLSNSVLFGAEMRKR
jgi:hypothetical protein